MAHSFYSLYRQVADNLDFSERQSKKSRPAWSLAAHGEAILCFDA
jgi:hypothetical protein